MPNLASTLKSEISRLARKEIRAEVEALKAAAAKYRTEISALKKQVGALEKVVARLGKVPKSGKARKEGQEDKGSVRFRVKGLISLRKRLGLSAAGMGALIGVSAQTVYNWELEKSRPRQQQIAAIAALRGIGKRQAAARLKELAG